MKCFSCEAELGDEPYREKYKNIRVCKKCGALNQLPQDGDFI